MLTSLHTPAADPIKATDSQIVFNNLPYGYYMVLSSLGSAVTINSNTPDVEVIDKNQTPGANFEKKIQTGVDAEGNPIWGDSNTVSIGDKVTYRISFTATNYDRINQIQYYQVHDNKGNAIWAEFNNFKVYVNGTELPRGYYLCAGDSTELNTDNWEYLGVWNGVEKNRNNAQWYLVHLGYDQYRISIPWLEGHTIIDITDSNGKIIGYKPTFPPSAAPKYSSPAEVVVTYDAAVEPNADIGGLGNGNLYNTAHVAWTSKNETQATSPDTVVTKVYGIGILKDDGTTSENLAGAEFRVYKDEDCTIPVYVIPTDIKGIYIVDSLGTYGNTISGTNRETAREEYEDYLEGYLGSDYATTQDNLVVSQANGKLAVLGLAEGTYYLKEVKAPDGYNSLSTPVELTVNAETTTSFNVFADADGNVADIQASDGTYLENTYMLTNTTVHNSKGVELPSTGGEGTFWLITIGTVVALAFAVLLITHKKMSVYHD